jgi:hypothetical protein
MDDPRTFARISKKILRTYLRDPRKNIGFKWSSKRVTIIAVFLLFFYRVTQKIHLAL